MKLNDYTLGSLNGPLIFKNWLIVTNPSRLNRTTMAFHSVLYAVIMRLITFVLTAGSGWNIENDLKHKTLKGSIKMTQIIEKKKTVKVELYHDHFQNYKRYNIPKAQLVIADIPYNLGVNAYASSTEWYIDGDNKKGESKKAGKAFFKTDNREGILI